MRQEYYEQLDAISDDLVRSDPPGWFGDEPRHPVAPRCQPAARRDRHRADADVDAVAPKSRRSAPKSSHSQAPSPPISASSSARFGSRPRWSGWAISPSTSPNRPGCAIPHVAIPTELRATFAEMGGIAEVIVSKTGAVIATKDVALAADIAAHDEKMDRLHRELFTIVLSPSWNHGVEAAIDVTLLSRYLRTICRSCGLGHPTGRQHRDW